MRVLICGNSHVGALWAPLRDGIIKPPNGIEINCYAVPGGQGPNFSIVDGRLNVTAIDDNYPPYTDSTDTVHRPLGEYDAIVVSALGYFVGGFAHRNQILLQGLVGEYRPKRHPGVINLVSQGCMRDIIRNGLWMNQGCIFLSELSRSYSGNIIVQPIPLLSEDVRAREDCELSNYYEDNLGFSRFLTEARDQALRELCDACSADLLDYPDPSFRAQGFTPRHLMHPKDGAHATGAYGVMVVQQIVTRVSPAN